MFHTFSTTSPFNIPPSPDFLYPLAPPPPPRRRRIPRRRRKAYLSRPPAYHDPPASNSALDTPALPHRAFFAGVYDAYDNRGRERGGEEDEEVARAETRRGARGYGFGPGEVAQREMGGEGVEVEKGKGGKGFWAYVRVEGVSEDVLRGAVEELMGEGGINFGAFGTFSREDRRKLPLPGWAVKEGREFGSTAQTAKVDVADEQMLRYNYFRGVADIAEANKPVLEMKRLQAEYKQKLANLQSPPEGCPHPPPERVPTQEEMDKAARKMKRLQDEYRQKLANLQSPPEACPGDKPESFTSS